MDRRTLVLAALAFGLGLALTTSLLFPVRFLVVAYEHGGFW